MAVQQTQKTNYTRPQLGFEPVSSLLARRLRRHRQPAAAPDPALRGTRPSITALVLAALAAPHAITLRGLIADALPGIAAPARPDHFPAIAREQASARCADAGGYRGFDGGDPPDRSPRDGRSAASEKVQAIWQAAAVQATSLTAEPAPRAPPGVH